MTNAEAVKVLQQINAENGMEVFLPFSRKDNLGDRLEAINLAIAALSPKPLKDEFPSFEAWRESGKSQIGVIRERFYFEITEFYGRITAHAYFCGEQFESLTTDLSPKNYDGLIAQLQAWVDGLIRELRGE